MSREGPGVSRAEDPMPCIVCGIRPAAEGSVCAECSAVLKSAVTGTVAPAASPAQPGRPGQAEDVSESPTSPRLTPTGVSSRPSLPSARDEEAAARRYAPGEELDDRYTIIEEIGAGGMGIVYKALDRKLEKTVALKLMRPKAMEPANVARFRRELALAQGVSHQNVCRVHDLGEVDGILYISMEHVEGQRLDYLIVSMGRLSPRQTVALGRQLCAGLRAIHEQGIIHRDLKPSNVMVNRSGHVFIMDFGLAIRPGRDKVTSTGAVLGTFAYLSPEQARGLEIGPRSDVYAAGLILYEMLTGMSPPGDDVALPLALRDAREACPPPSAFAPDVPPELDRVVMRCLERDPGKRFGSAQELEAELAALSGDLGATTARSAARRTTDLLWRDPRSGRVRRGSVALVVALVAMAALGVHTWLRPSSAGTRPVLAVLPFSDIGPNGSAGHLGLGLSDVIITHLAASPHVTVIAPAALRRASAAEALTVAEDLGATHTVSGSIQSDGGRVRVAVTVLRIADSVVVGGGEDESSMASIFDLPGRLAERVIGALQVELDAEQKRRLALAPTSDTTAFEQYSLAKELLRKVDEKGNLERAIELLESATGRDPKFALAHAALGDACLMKFLETKDPRWTARASASILQALSIDPDQAAVRMSLAKVLHHTGRPEQAIQELQRAMGQKPDSSEAHEAHRLMAILWDAQGRTEDALAAARTAIALRPDNWQHHYTLGDILRRAQRLEEAAAAAREVIRLRPEGERGYRLLGNCYILQGRNALALENYERAYAIAPSGAVASNIGTIRFGQHDYAAAAQAYQRALTMMPSEPALYMNLARAQERMGSPAARESYERAYALLQTLVDTNPNDVRHRALLAICELKLGRGDRAILEIEQAMAIAPTNREVMYRASVIYAASGRKEQSLSMLGKALDAGYSLALVERGDGLEAYRDLPEFKALLERARAKQKAKDK